MKSIKAFKVEDNQARMLKTESAYKECVCTLTVPSFTSTNVRVIVHGSFVVYIAIPRLGDGTH